MTAIRKTILQITYSQHITNLTTDYCTSNDRFGFNFHSAANQKIYNTRADMAKIVIKTVKPSPFGGIISIMEQFDSNHSSVIDSTLSIIVSCMVILFLCFFIRVAADLRISFRMSGSDALLRCSPGSKTSRCERLHGFWF